MKQKTKKVEVHRFWISSTSSVGKSQYKLFVNHADYVRATKKIAELESKIKKLEVKA